MSIKTLAEHKAETLAEEEIEAEETTQVELEEVKETATEEAEPELDASADEEEEGEAEPEQEAWMQSEADNSQSDDDLSKNSNAAFAAIRLKYKGKAEASEDKHKQELADLQAQLAEAQKQNITASPSPVVSTAKPKRDDFFEADDQDEAFIEATLTWRENQGKAQHQRTQLQAVQKKHAEIQNLALDEHYSRAANLGNGITAESYQQADYQVKAVLGEVTTNQLIAALGDGSEKVFYNLGRNPTKLAELQIAIQTDPSGLKAAMLLGKMSSAASPNKRRSSAPAPANTARGDANAGKVEKNLRKTYEKASKNGSAQEAFNARRAAKAQGIDTKDW